MDKAEELTDPAARAKAWGRARQATSPARCYFIPWLWDNKVNYTVDEREGSAEQVQRSAWDLDLQLAEVTGRTLT